MLWFPICQERGIKEEVREVFCSKNTIQVLAGFRGTTVGFP